ncbi:MAG: dihydrofolate reductase family protein [Phycisphaerae bacterium]|nr:dihydrofolate reductase family protein [Saprospiraceae bacterium]
MRKLILFMHTSLDGFVAGLNGEMDWIHVDDEMFDFTGKRIEASDTALYGRVTYEMMEGYWPTAGEHPEASKHDIEHSKWYNSASKVVLSKSMQGQVLPNTTIISDHLAENINRLKQSGTEQEILIFGSPSAAHSLMQLDLIDGYWLFLNPILLGEGIPLFPRLEDHKKLKLVSSHVFPSGVIALQYEHKNE